MKEKLQQLAKKASLSFIEEGIPLNTSIAGIAKEDGLEKEMVSRICEMANMITRLHYFKQPDVDQARLQFDIASPDGVLKESPTEEPIKDLFDTPVDYLTPPVNTKPAVKVIDITPEEPDVKVIEIQIHQKKAEMEDQNARLQIAYMKYLDTREAFIKEAKSHLNDGHPVSDLNELGDYIDKQAGLKMMLPQLKVSMEKQAYELEDLINKDLNVTYVIGNHPLTVKYLGSVTAAEDVRNAARNLNETSSAIDSLERTIEVESVDLKKKDLSKEAASISESVKKIIPIIPKSPGLGPADAVGKPGLARGIGGKVWGMAKKHPVMAGLIGVPLALEAYGAFKRNMGGVPQEEINMARQQPGWEYDKSDLKGRDWRDSYHRRDVGEQQWSKEQLDRVRGLDWDTIEGRKA